MNTRIIFCIDCGCDIEIGPLQHGTLRCKDCGAERQKFLAEIGQKKRLKKSRRPAKGKKCRCGCGRPVGKNLTWLSKHCYMANAGKCEGQDEENIYDDFRTGQGGCRLTEKMEVIK